jgi:hypothetical protein
MARAHRVAFISTVLTALWTLVFFQVFAVPLLDAGAVEQVWPFVSLVFLCACGILTNGNARRSPGGSS